KFGDNPVALYPLGPKMGVLELWHGPTCAFKDMALQLLPHLLTASMQKTNDDSRAVILVATSGDTGKAALEGFKNVPGTDVIVFYPADGVSETQRLQMITTEGSNVKVFGIRGNFDDAQRSVKEIFEDREFAKVLAEKKCVLSSANSINWGRLVPQIVYYFSAYCDAVKQSSIAMGDPVNFCVPTGNFGDILAGYYAMKMGLPVHRLICASNSNNVLTDFLADGEYNANREFYKTMSPSMDILVSSNLERLLYDAEGTDGETVRRYMDALKKTRKFKVSEKAFKAIKSVFAGEWTSEEKTGEQMQLLYGVKNYLADPHTAVALQGAQTYLTNNSDNNYTIVLSTANPYKFSKDVYQSVKGQRRETAGDDYTAKLYAQTKVKIPEPLRGLRERPVLHPEVIDVTEMRDKIAGFVGRN
ncbi:MAG: threonine synthase, partial [Acidaminococcaceae bacterium]|nr:threonine synthase [Acidaminococcaceae bacterium]